MDNESVILNDFGLSMPITASAGWRLSKIEPFIAVFAISTQLLVIRNCFVHLTFS